MTASKKNNEKSKAMKAILEFDLPEEAFEFRRATNGNRWAQIVYGIDETLRQWNKYNENLTAEQKEAYQKVRDLICTEMLENNLDFDQ